MEAEFARLEAEGLYHPEQEHASCGVGLVVAIDGKPRRQVVENGIKALSAIWHRGAVDADGKTGDGAGIHVQIPVGVLRGPGAADRAPAARRAAGGRADLPAAQRLRRRRRRRGRSSRPRCCAWATTSTAGGTCRSTSRASAQKANATRPEIEQILISNAKGVDEETFERELYVIRRRIEKAAAGIRDFYICSMSCRSIIYKGMMLAETVSIFYPDLQDPRFESAFAIYHQRYSTNTFPRWWLAQPFRMLAHNGEINTLKGNLNWLKSHEIRMSSDYFGELAEDIKPIVLPGSLGLARRSTTSSRCWCAPGGIAPMAKSMLVPEAWSKLATKMPQAWQDMYAYSNAVMEPWDGPAALAMTDGRWVCGGLDRNGLRPMRYVVTGDGLVIAGSEAGHGADRRHDARSRRARSGRGSSSPSTWARAGSTTTPRSRTCMAASQPFGEWVGSITDLDALTGGAEERPIFEGAELRRRQIAAGYSVEELETVLAAMAEDGKEAIGSMGDDTPPAVLSNRYRPLSHYFRQNFSQVTNPPIDSLREHRVMSLKTRFGNLKNVLDQDNSQTEILQLESPFVSNARFAAMVAQFGDAAVEIDCTFAPGPGRAAGRASARIRAEAEEAVRAGANHMVLTDMGQGAERVAMPMILATSAVHSWLTRKGLRTFTSLNVRSGECIDPHYFAVLIGSGATTVNAYLAQDSIADRVARGLIAGTLTEAVERFRTAIDQGLLKIISKMGIAVISSYRGGLNFEAVGLSRAMVAEYFPGMLSRISGIGITGVQRQVEGVHALAWRGGDAVLPIGGFYKARRSGESHAWEARAMHILQSACDRGSYDIWKQYSKAMQARPPIHLRDLLDFQPKAAPVPLDQVESITAIRKRFVTPGMSLGALAPEAHKTLNVAMNRIGAKSDSRRGRRGPGALRAGAERRQPERQDQAGGERAVRGDGGLSQPLRGAGDQDRPGREARRGRAAARDQGDRADRASSGIRRRG